MTQQVPLPFGLDAEYTFTRFLPGPNGEVIRHLKAIAHGDGNMPLFIHGPSDSGKSHLLQACCIEAGEQGRQTMLIPLRSFKDYGTGILEGLESLDCLCLDDLDGVAGSTEWEIALFSLYNLFKERDAKLVITAKSPPGQLGINLKDLESRLSSGPIFGMHSLTEEESVQAMMERAKSLGLELSESVALYLLRRVERDLGSLLRYLDRLDRASMASSRKLTIPFIRTTIDFDR